MVIVTLGLYLSDSRTRGPFMNFAVANALAFFLQQTLADGPLSNLILAIYFMSKVSSSREYLQVAPVSMDKALTTFTNHENAKIKANVNRVYKNLNSDVNEAIEEGAVATLIAMSLEVLLLATSASHTFNLSPYLWFPLL